MTRSKRLMLLIDKMFDKSQNPKKMLKKYEQDVKVEKDIVFDESCADQKLNTYYVPRTDGSKYPVIFEIHGGGFSAGDKEYRRCLCHWFAKETGAFVVNVNYGLGPDYIAPAPLQHLVKAFNWVIANADKYNLDTDKMLVTGDSAGGYYAAMLAVLPDNDKLQEIYGHMNGRFTASILNSALVNIDVALKNRLILDLNKYVCQDFTGITIDKIDTYPLFPYISPSHFVTPNFPKTLVLYSPKDMLCKGQGEALIEQLNSLGVHCEGYGSKRFLDNHTFPLTWKSKAAKEATALELDFANRFFADKI